MTIFIHKFLEVCANFNFSMLGCNDQKKMFETYFVFNKEQATDVRRLYLGKGKKGNSQTPVCSNFCSF